MMYHRTALMRGFLHPVDISDRMMMIRHYVDQTYEQKGNRMHCGTP